MRIILAKTAGFCMGVKRAMETVLSIARNEPGPVFTYGPLIHNRQAVEMLEARGIHARTDLDDMPRGTVLIRTHGAPPDVIQSLRDAGLDVRDGTCPHVLKGQRWIARRSRDGWDVIIVGDRDHDEVQGLAGRAAGRCSIVATVEEAGTVPLGDRVLVVAQTTFNAALFHDIVETLKARKPDIEVVDSICRATSERQEEAEQLARRVDAMVVVGGLHSANTRRLADIARSTGTPTFHVETAGDLAPEALARFDTVGVTAGASTPSWITASVIERLREIGRASSGPARLWNALVRVVIDGNLYVAAGAAALTYAVIQMLGLRLHSHWDRASLMTASFGYIFSAYALGRTAEDRAGGLGLTRRAAFYREHPLLMAAAMAVLATLSIAVLVPFGWPAVALLGASYAMAFAYGLLLSPRTRGRLALLRNLPASKDILVAAGWTGVLVWIPVVAARGANGYAVGVAAAFVFGFAFIRSVMFDFSDVVGDRLLGRDTFPALVGVVRAKSVLVMLAGLLAAVIAAGTAAGVVAGPGYWMLAVPAYALAYLLVFGRWVTASERRCAVVVDGGMLLCGLIAVIHAILV